MSEDSRDEQLEEIAKEHVAEIPGETALGHRDPDAGGEGEPADFKGNEDVTLPE
jgi:hypothetical protein